MTTPPKSKPLLQTEKPVRSRPRKRDPQQPNLPRDPMLARIEPCLALLKAKPPKGHQWAFEVSGTATVSQSISTMARSVLSPVEGKIPKLAMVSCGEMFAVEKEKIGDLAVS